jgi:hypothetical protein
MKLELSLQISDKYSHIKFYENLPSERRVVACGQTDMTKLIVALRSFTDAAKNVREESAEQLCDLKLKDISYTR